MTAPDAPNEAAHDFRHAAMHRMADWPVLAQIVAARKSEARRLDSLNRPKFAGGSKVSMDGAYGKK